MSPPCKAVLITANHAVLSCRTSRHDALGRIAVLLSALSLLARGELASKQKNERRNLGPPSFSLASNFTYTATRSPSFPISSYSWLDLGSPEDDVLFIIELQFVLMSMRPPSVHTQIRSHDECTCSATIDALGSIFGWQNAPLAPERAITQSSRLKAHLARSFCPRAPLPLTLQHFGISYIRDGSRLLRHVDCFLVGVF
jgi:hypothetical protein